MECIYHRNLPNKSGWYPTSIRNKRWSGVYTFHSKVKVNCIKTTCQVGKINSLHTRFPPLLLITQVLDSVCVLTPVSYRHSKLSNFDTATVIRLLKFYHKVFHGKVPNIGFPIDSTPQVLYQVVILRILTQMLSNEMSSYKIWARHIKMLPIFTLLNCWMIHIPERIKNNIAVFLFHRGKKKTM